MRRNESRPVRRTDITCTDAMGNSVKVLDWVAYPGQQGHAAQMNVGQVEAFLVTPGGLVSSFSIRSVLLLPGQTWESKGWGNVPPSASSVHKFENIVLLDSHLVPDALKEFVETGRRYHGVKQHGK